MGRVQGRKNANPMRKFPQLKINRQPFMTFFSYSVLLCVLQLIFSLIAVPLLVLVICMCLCCWIRLVGNMNPRHQKEREGKKKKGLRRHFACFSFLSLAIHWLTPCLFAMPIRCSRPNPNMNATFSCFCCSRVLLQRHILVVHLCLARRKSLLGTVFHRKKSRSPQHSLSVSRIPRNIQVTPSLATSGL